MSKLQCSPLTQSLLNTKIKIGEHSVDVSATWANEMEYGRMSPTAAQFWSEHEDELHAGCDVSEVLDSLNEQGLIEPDQLDELQEDADYLDGDIEYVRQGIEFRFPSVLFEDSEIAQVQDSAASAADSQGTQFTSTQIGADESKIVDAILPLEEFVRWKRQADEAASVHRARQRLCWASAATKRSAGPPASEISLDLLQRIGDAHRLQCDKSANKYFHLVSDANSEFFPEPGPCVWCHTKGWKGSSGSVTVKVKQQMTLGEYLQQELCAEVGWIHEQLFCSSLSLGDCDPEWEEWNCKCAEMQVMPPA